MSKWGYPASSANEPVHFVDPNYMNNITPEQSQANYQKGVQILTTAGFKADVLDSKAITEIDENTPFAVYYLTLQ